MLDPKDRTTMASLFGKLAGIARSPHGQRMIAQATQKAQRLAKDPATRAKIEQGTARVRAEVAKRRGPATPPAATPPATPPADGAPDDVTPR